MLNPTITEKQSSLEKPAQVKVEECSHKRLRYVGIQYFDDNPSSLLCDCIDCLTTVALTNEYVPINKEKDLFVKIQYSQRH
ncbi:MAG TPA: hypothetical protein VJH65_00245 [Candidatus Nanoarchaeia archaeon]|nr:hypothetical protein [Candidatus Nanoarchaeia archaeon]